MSELSEIIASNLASALDGHVIDRRPLDCDRTDDPAMWIFVRADLKIPLEKLVAQGGHAGFNSAWIRGKTEPQYIDNWVSRGQAKITKRARNLGELQKVVDLCRQAGLPTTIVTDAARTFFDEPTMTVASVGPCMRSELPKWVDGLQLLKRKDVLALQPQEGDA